VSEQFLRDIPIAVGKDGEPVKITTHDIRNEACDIAWNQGHVRQGYVVSRHWKIDIKSAENYELELRRWPQEAGHNLGDGIVFEMALEPGPDHLYASFHDNRERTIAP
jgi:hypothetical protein